MLDLEMRCSNLGLGHDATCPQTEEFEIATNSPHPPLEKHPDLQLPLEKRRETAPQRHINPQARNSLRIQTSAHARYRAVESSRVQAPSCKAGASYHRYLITICQHLRQTRSGDLTPHHRKSEQSPTAPFPFLHAVSTRTGSPPTSQASSLFGRQNK
ncbi:hypothetical protein MFRU_016g00350 [Monilinia fructicola]|nr:hypothetical protein MFRU_016g00350 [Monilinia fructicola]